MIPTPEEPSPPVSISPRRSSGEGPRFCNLRGVRWRINLGILPSSLTVSVEDIRRVAADSRRSYASLRRRLLIDPHTMKDGNRSPDLAMDNPLSQNPESTWGRFFHHAEIEKMVDQDLSRLYPENGSYFQTLACQGMLRRILLLWCLSHPECGYGQGMHELLAPLVYVLHADLDYLSKVRGLYGEYFNDEFDGLSYLNNDLGSHYRIKKAKSWDSGGNGDLIQGNESKITGLDDLDQDTQDVYLLSDAYGAEGELGVVISERFMEHDAYNMFDALMSGAHGVVSMADFFSVSPAIGSSTGLPPIIEASSALYHLLSVVDSSLHSHLVELGVEPQYFALRWLRVLFEREFSLNDLLVIWDEMFSSSNASCLEDEEYQFRVLCSPRGVFISAMAVSMLLHVRSSLLATENATSCLQRLLNFSRNVNVKKLIEKARSIEVLALEANISASSLQQISTKSRSSTASRAGSVSPKTTIRILPDSYWEEKWRVLHKEETLQGSDFSKGNKIKDLFGKKLGLSRAESDPSPAKNLKGKKQAGHSVRRRLLDDFSLDFESHSDTVHLVLPGEGSSPLNEDTSKCSIEERCDQNITRISEEPHDQIILSSSHGIVADETRLSTESSLVSFVAIAPNGEGNDADIESETSCLTSNSVIGENEEENNLVEDECNSGSDNPMPDQVEADAATAKSGLNGDVEGVVPEIKERKTLSSKFQWFWKFGKGSEGTLERGAVAKTQKASYFGNGNVCRETVGISASDPSSCNDAARIEVGDKKMMGTLKNLGQSMLENIQAIESVFQQDRGQAGKGQATAIAALKELRKVSNLLSEM